MHAIQVRTDHRHEHPVSVGPFPWEEAHAAPEDRAVGLELELIELVSRRTTITDGHDAEALALDREIELTLAELGSITTFQLAV